MNTKNQNQITTNKQIIQFFLLALLIASFIFAYFPVWKRLVLTWYSSDEYSHGFFIVPLCCYIIWRKKKVLADIPVRSSSWGLALIIFSLLLYLLAHFAKIMTVTSFSMVLLIAGVSIYFYGFLMFRNLLFPLFLLLFMIPIPLQIYSSLTVPLQLFVSKVSVGILNLCDLPIFREGNVIQLPGQTLQIVEACSGLRSVITLLLLGAILGYLTIKSNFLRTLLFFSGIPIAILVNVVRVLLLILTFYYFNYDLTTGTVHTVFGLVIFMLALIFIFVVKGVLSIWDRSATLR